MAAYTFFDGLRRIGARLGALALLAPLALAAGACGGASGGSGAQTRYDTVTVMSGLRYIDYEKGSGDEVQPGMKVAVEYAGYLADGTLFDTSIDSVGRLYNRQGKPFSGMEGTPNRTIYFNRGGYPFQPLEFVVGQGNVIRGWDEGLTTAMRVGGRRRLLIPAELGYGAQGAGTIPPNAMLIFDVEVVRAEFPGTSGEQRR